MRLLVCKEYIVLFLLVFLTGCVSTPSIKTIAEVCNGVSAQKSVSQNVPSEEKLLVKSKRVERLEAKEDERSEQIASRKPLVATTDKEKLLREELLAASKEIDRLEAEIAEHQTRLRAYPRYPRRYFVGARAKNADVALYMEAWRQKVEKFGNENYPETARKYHIYGKVQLTTSIKSDGSYEKAVLDRSSGCKVLDDHALSIVRNAAPYLPFSESMKDRFDILSITRTFRYIQENDSQVLSSPPN